MARADAAPRSTSMNKYTGKICKAGCSKRSEKLVAPASGTSSQCKKMPMAIVMPTTPTPTIGSRGPGSTSACQPRQAALPRMSQKDRQKWHRVDKDGESEIR